MIFYAKGKHKILRMFWIKGEAFLFLHYEQNGKEIKNRLKLYIRAINPEWNYVLQVIDVKKNIDATFKAACQALEVAAQEGF